ncbi:MAG: hypothetical protein R3B93_23930 [Bacteroidia bacterium]
MDLQKNYAFIFVILVFFAFHASKSRASHIMGGDITYQCLANNQYLVTLKVFRDCGGVQLGNSQILKYSSATCGVNVTTPLLQQGVSLDITPVCPGQVSSCSGGFGIPGIQEFTYKGTINLPPGCGNDWVLSWSSCCRNNAITTLLSPGSNGTYFQATLDNTVSPCNNSPVFNNNPTPVICVNQPIIIIMVFRTRSGDNLVFSIVSCQSTALVPVSYGGMVIMLLAL